MKLIQAIMIFIGAAAMSITVVYLQPLSKQIAYPLHFHESWNPQQRHTLQHMLHLLRDVAPAEATAKDLQPFMLSAYIAGKYQRPFTGKAWLYHTLYMRAAHDPCRVVQQTAASGSGGVQGKDGLSLALLAIRLGMPEMTKEMVRRGTNPNQRLYFEDDDLKPNPAYEDLLSAAVGQSPLVAASPLTPEKAEDIVRWLLNNGAAPNKSHLATLCICCQMEMILHNRLTCTALVLDKLNSLPAKQQADLAATMLHLNIPGSWSTFESLFNKGLFTREGIEINESIFISIFTNAPADAPEKTEKLIALGFDPNYRSHPRDRKEFDCDEDYEDYVFEYSTEKAPLNVLIDGLRYFTPEDGVDEQQQHQTRLQCLEILLRHGVTAELYESDLPEDDATREKVTALLEQYKVPILTEEENTE